MMDFCSRLFSAISDFNDIDFVGITWGDHLARGKLASITQFRKLPSADSKRNLGIKRGTIQTTLLHPNAF